MTKATISQLEATIADLQAQLDAATSGDIPRGRVYLEGPLKFFRQAINRSTNEPMNYYEFVISDTSNESRPDGTTFKVDLPFDQCRVSGNRPDVVRQLSELVAFNSFVVVRVHGAWRPDGPIQLVNGYARCQRKAFWVTRVDVLHTIAKDGLTQRSAPVFVPDEDLAPFSEEPTLSAVDF